jgi:hypothetical protein
MCRTHISMWGTCLSKGRIPAENTFYREHMYMQRENTCKEGDLASTPLRTVTGSVGLIRLLANAAAPIIGDTTASITLRLCVCVCVCVCAQSVPSLRGRPLHGGATASTGFCLPLAGPRPGDDCTAFCRRRFRWLQCVVKRPKGLQCV